MSTLGRGAAGAQAQRAGAAPGMALGVCLARGSMLLLWRAGALQGVALAAAPWSWGRVLLLWQPVHLKLV